MVHHTLWFTQFVNKYLGVVSFVGLGRRELRINVLKESVACLLCWCMDPIRRAFISVGHFTMNLEYPPPLKDAGGAVCKHWCMDPTHRVYISLGGFTITPMTYSLFEFVFQSKIGPPPFFKECSSFQLFIGIDFSMQNQTLIKVKSCPLDRST